MKLLKESLRRYGLFDTVRLYVAVLLRGLNLTITCRDASSLSKRLLSFGKKVDDPKRSHRIALKVHFYREDEVASSIASNASANELLFGEILLFCCFALRQMLNLGTKHPVSLSLANALASNQDPLLPLTLYLGPPSPSHTLYALRSSTRQGVYEGASKRVSVDLIKFVLYHGELGKKYFIATLDFHAQRALFQLRPQGFGLLGAGVNYYAPLSVGLLPKHLADSRPNSPVYLSQLSFPANLCGRAFLDGKLSIPSQHVWASRIAHKATAPPNQPSNC